MSINLLIDEMLSIQNEIKRNTCVNRKLKSRLSTIETEVRDYLNQKNQAGLKYKDVTISVEDFKRCKTKNKKDKKVALIAYLSSIGVSNPEDEYNKLMNAQKEESVDVQKIKIKHQ